MKMKYILPAGVLILASGFTTILGVGAAAAQQIHSMSLGAMFPDAQVRALARAAGRGRVEKVEALVAQGVDVNARGTLGYTPLFWALGNRNAIGFEKLLELGADPDIIFERGQAIMRYLLWHDDTEFLEMVLEHGGDPDLRADYEIGSGWFFATPLFGFIDASLYGSGFRGVPNDRRPHIHLLLKAGANINARAGAKFKPKFGDHHYYEGITPVIYAAEQRVYDIVLELLNLGADHRLEDNKGRGLAYHIISDDASYFAEREWYFVTDELEELFDWQWSLITQQRKEVIAWLLERGERIPELETTFADPKVRDLAGDPSLYVNQAERVEELAAQGADVNARGENGVSPLLWRLMISNLSGFEKLLELGADPNIVLDRHNPLTPSIAIRNGGSIMHWAAGHESNSGFLKSALSHGGNPNLVTGPSGETPLFKTISAIKGDGLDRDRADNRSMLLGAGADIDARSHGEVRGASGGGRTPVMVAADIGRYDIVRELLYRGADYALKDDSGAGLVERVVSRMEESLSSGGDGEKDFHDVVAWLSERGVEISGTGRRDAEGKRGP